MIAGLEEVSAGEVFIDDEMVTDWPPKQRDIAMVFQNYALYPHMTVRQNMGFALRLRHVDRQQAQAQVQDPLVCSGCPPCSIASRRRCRAASANVSRWAARWCVSHACSCWTSRCPTSMPSSGCRCAPNSPGCISGIASPRPT
jgi:ABC-type antimicrobial peptide transport system ATPase subunit